MSKQDLIKSLHNIYTITYPPSGYSVVSGKFNKVLVLKGSNDDDYLHHPLTLITSFLGLPNRKLGKQAPQSWRNLFYNLIGWQPDTSLGKKIVNAISIPMVMLWHVFIMLPSLAKNIIKLATELLPALIKFGLAVASDKLKQQAERVAQPVKSLALLGLYTVNLLYYATSFIYFVGRATTSPLNGARCAFRDGRQFGRSLAPQGSKTSKVLGWLFGIALSSLSSAATTIVYALTFPVAIKAMAIYMVPTIVTTLPSVMTTHLAPAAKVILQLATKPLDVLGKVVGNKIMHAFKPVYCTLGAPLAETVVRNVGIRVGQLFALGINTVQRHLNHWWRKPNSAPYEESERESLLHSSSSRIQQVIGIKRDQPKLQISHSFDDLKANIPSPSGKGMRLFQSLDVGRVVETEKRRHLYSKP